MLAVFSAIITDKTRNVATNWRRSTKMKRKQKVANKSQKNKITKSMNKIKCIQQILGENEIWCSTFCALLTLTHTSVTVRHIILISSFSLGFGVDSLQIQTLERQLCWRTDRFLLLQSGSCWRNETTDSLETTFTFCFIYDSFIDSFLKLFQSVHQCNWI